MAINWSTIQGPQLNVPGIPDYGPGGWNWDAWYNYHKEYDALVQSGQRVIINIVGAPCWAHTDIGCDQGTPGSATGFTPGGAPDDDPSDGGTALARPGPNHIYDWYQFVQSVAYSFQPGNGYTGGNGHDNLIHTGSNSVPLAFEVWNEPNLTKFWGTPNASSPEQIDYYAYNVLYWATQAITPYSNRPILIGGLFTGAKAKSDPGATQGSLDYVEELYRTTGANPPNAASYTSGLSFHPYPAWAAAGESGTQARIDDTMLKVSQFNTRVPGGETLGITEYGVPSKTDINEPEDGQKQAAYLTGVFSQLNGMSPRVWFALVNRFQDDANFRGGPGQPLDYLSGWSGALVPSVPSNSLTVAAKPAYCQLAALNLAQGAPTPPLCQPPPTTLDSGPGVKGASSYTTLKRPTFTFSSTMYGGAFVCKMDGGTYSLCPDVTSFTPASDLSEGQHTFYVAAISSAGVGGPEVSVTFTVDTVAPTTTLDPSGPNGNTDRRTVTFVFSSNEPGALKCSFDGSTAQTCTSPATYGPLLPGSHSFSVYAVDQAGNVGNAQSRSFNVQTALVKDIYAGAGGSTPTSLVKASGNLYFAATDATNGAELWKSDGTSAGTSLIKDIYAGATGSTPTGLTNVGGNDTVFFAAQDTSNGIELWKTNGTTAGTSLVKDIFPGTGLFGVNSSSPAALTDVGGTLFFTASDGVNGIELWKSDGTSSGTTLVKDIQPGAGASTPTGLTNVNGTLFFAANDGTNGTELWKSDGTSAGTTMVKNINPAGGLSSPTGLANVNGTVFFAADDGTNGIELWKSDGTSGGTVLVKDIYPGAFFTPFSSSPAGLTNVNGTLFFTATDGTNGIELWKSTGTTAGTTLVKDINAGAGASTPTGLTNINGTLFLAATDATSGAELWKSDGTTSGTTLVKDILAGSGGSTPTGLARVGGSLFFAAQDASNGVEPWLSDGTSATTVMVKDVYPGSFLGPNSSSPANFTDVGGRAFYTANDGTSGVELWTLGP